MWKVLLVEDEVFVRETIRETIRWEDEGFEVVGEAGNGQEALDMIRNYKPDLVISDIVMPLMNGVDLLKKIREEKYDCEFVMLSCMNDFENVRQALELSAFNYILKLSMNVKTLRETLAKVNTHLIQRMNGNMGVMKDAYHAIWKRIMGLEKLESDPVIPEKFHSLHLRVFITYAKETFLAEDFYKLSHIPKDDFSFVHLFRCSNQVSIFAWSLRETNLECEGAVKEGDFLLSSRLITGADLMSEWRHMLRKADAYWYNSDFIENKAYDLKKADLDGNINWKYEKELVYQFEQMNIDACKELIQHIGNHWKRNIIPMFFVKEKAEGLVETFARISNMTNIDSNDILNTTSQDQLLSVLMNKLEYYLHCRIEEGQRLTDHDEVNKIIIFIEQNFEKDITVKLLAKYVAMDENYISSLFKKKTGYSPIHFLQRVRVDRAKGYLAESKMSVNEIAEKVGFANDNYFIKIFKRWTGTTPSVYRNSMTRN